MRRALLACGLGLALLAGGCGGVTEVREDDLVAGIGVRTEPAEQRAPRAGGDEVRIAMVTHGAPASAFWNIVRNGAEAAARQTQVQLRYRSPDEFSTGIMRALIDDAIDERPDGLVVSLPTPLIADAIRHATAAGIPVVSINSGTELYRRMGALAHVGQLEERAGLQAGRRLVDAGGENGLCVKNGTGNVGLDARCRGFARAMRRAGGRATELVIDPEQREQTNAALAGALTDDPDIDTILALNTSGAVLAMELLERLGAKDRVRVGAFDLSPEALQAVKDGDLVFIVDQQPFLQGYLPVVMLANHARYGVFPAQGQVVPTGPHFVTAFTADQAIRLNEQGIR